MIIFTLRDAFVNPSPNIVVQKHNHISLEFTYLIRGSCTITANSAKHHVGQNQYYIVGPNVYHSLKTVGEIKTISFRMEIKGIPSTDNSSPIQESQVIQDMLHAMIFFVKKDDGTVIRIIKEIQHELKSPMIGFYTSISSMLSQLIIKITRDYNADSLANYIALEISFDNAVSEIETFLYENYCQQVSICELAQRLHFSTRQVERILRQEFNMSLKQKIIEKRIEFAKSLLETTNIPVKNIAEKVGYDASNFSAIFKKKAGFTPLEYRKYYSEIGSDVKNVTFPH